MDLLSITVYADDQYKSEELKLAGQNSFTSFQAQLHKPLGNARTDPQFSGWNSISAWNPINIILALSLVNTKMHEVGSLCRRHRSFCFFLDIFVVVRDWPGRKHVVQEGGVVVVDVDPVVHRVPSDDVTMLGAQRSWIMGCKFEFR